jgi:D-3-phosphoglycerate dehydrogenase
MSDPVDALVLDLLEWIGEGSRPYDEVLDAWRTSCPRLPVWEEANDRGLIERRRSAGGTDVISVSPAGVRYLRSGRPAPVTAGRA